MQTTWNINIRKYTLKSQYSIRMNSDAGNLCKFTGLNDIIYCNTMHKKLNILELELELELELIYFT